MHKLTLPNYNPKVRRLLLYLQNNYIKGIINFNEY